MNCEPGDLAVIVRGEPENYGIFIRVVRPALDGAWEFEDASRIVTLFDEDNNMFFGRASTDFDGGGVLYDRDMHPIRDQPGADEILAKAGPPADAKSRETEGERT